MIKTMINQTFNVANYVTLNLQTYVHQKLIIEYKLVANYVTLNLQTYVHQNLIIEYKLM